MTSPLSFMIGLEPTGLDEFVAAVHPAGIYGLNHTVAYPGVQTVKRVQNAVWSRLPDACGIDNYFLTEDPVASARHELTEKTIFVRGQNLNLLQFWGLDADTWYAPYNEWVLGEGADRFAKADWMSAWTCEAIRLAAADGKRLCIGSFATGTPTLDVLPNLFPMFRLAKQNGGVLDVHEYGVEGALMSSPSSGALRYRQIYNALPADCIIPIVISEFWWGNGFESFTSIAAQIEDAAAYGRELAKDSYLLWASAFQLDAGAESNFTTDAVSAYAVAASKIQKEEEVIVIPMEKIVGLHSRAGGGDLQPVDVDTITKAGGKLTGFKFTTQDARGNHAVVKSLGIPTQNCITRLYWDSRGFTTLPTPEQFFEWFRLPIQESLVDGINVIEFLNEPNIPDEWKWSAAEFVTFAKQVIALIRQSFSQTIVILTPGLAPAANTAAWDDTFQADGLYDACDGIGAHAYGTQPAHLNDDNELRYYRRFAPRLTGLKKIWITEASLKFYSITPYEVGSLYGEYVNTLEDYVQGVFFFVLQGEPFASSGEEWTSHQDIAKGLAEYAVPVKRYQFAHYHLDGGAEVTTNPITITMDATHTLVVDAIEVSPPPIQRFMLSVTVNPPGSLVVTLDPPQPVDGYLAGTVVTVTAAPA